VTLTGIGDAFRQCLIDLDTGLVRKLWPSTVGQADAEIMVSLHYSRTLAESVPFRLRAYSHAWLSERSLPSGLPDWLRPKAQRLYPCVVPGVGISVNFSSPEMQPVGWEIQGAMENAVLEVHADGKIGDSDLVKSRMAAARKRVFRELMIPFKRR
jgi:hypothetical protein